jgi:hypothetical protein
MDIPKSKMIHVYMILLSMVSLRTTSIEIGLKDTILIDVKTVEMKTVQMKTVEMKTVPTLAKKTTMGNRYTNTPHDLTPFGARHHFPTLRQFAPFGAHHRAFCKIPQTAAPEAIC